jgi:hypothetical protein
MNQIEPVWNCLHGSYVVMHLHIKDMRTFHKIIVKPTPLNQLNTSDLFLSQYILFQDK